MFLLFVPDAAAYPWMVRHGYTGCAQCHVDPSGSGALTSYGRGVGELLLGAQWEDHPDDWEPGASKEFLFGAFTLPEAVTLQVDTRGLFIPRPGDFAWILMQADLRGHVDLGPVRAYASAGTVSDGAQAAWITSNDAGYNVVSREHWLAVDPVKGLVIRAGRMNLPFGIRSEEHILYTRQLTRTDTNADQQLGVSALWNKGPIRTEVMGIAGNFQVSPDAFRERGYSGIFALAPSKTFEAGVSSLVTSAELDVDTTLPRTRQAHGVFARGAVGLPLVAMGEADLLLDRSDGVSATGATGTLQVDVEPVQGLHLRATGEWCDADFADGVAGVASEWLTAQWFFTSHADLRLDIIHGSIYCTPGAELRPMGLAQLHFFL